MKHTIRIRGDHIELFRLLKLSRIVETGWQAKELIRRETVKIGDATILELRKKVRPGDTVICWEEIIETFAEE